MAVMFRKLNITAFTEICLCSDLCGYYNSHICVNTNSNSICEQKDNRSKFKEGKNYD